MPMAQRYHRQEFVCTQKAPLLTGIISVSNLFLCTIAVTPGTLQFRTELHQMIQVCNIHRQLQNYVDSHSHVLSFPKSIVKGKWYCGPLQHLALQVGIYIVVYHVVLNGTGCLGGYKTVGSFALSSIMQYKVN